MKLIVKQIIFNVNNKHCRTVLEHEPPESAIIYDRKRPATGQTKVVVTQAAAVAVSSAAAEAGEDSEHDGYDDDADDDAADRHPDRGPAGETSSRRRTAIFRALDNLCNAVAWTRSAVRNPPTLIYESKA